MENNYLEDLELSLDDAIGNFEKRLTQIRAGRANPSSLDPVFVEYYGAKTPLKQLASISVVDGNELLIKPFDKSTLKEIERGINEANLGFNPINSGESIRIVMPTLTEDRRKELVKQAKEMSEDTRVTVRNLRRDILDNIRKDKLPEDEEKTLEKNVQDMVNEYNKKIDSIFDEKEKELLTI